MSIGRWASFLMTMLFFFSFDVAYATPRIPQSNEVVLLTISRKEAQYFDSYEERTSSVEALLISAKWSLKHASVTGNQRFFGDAISSVETVLRRDNQNAEAYLLRSIIEQRLHQFDKALVDINRALELNPNDAQSLLMKASILQVVGKADESRSLCSRLHSNASPLVFTTCLSIAAGLSGGLRTSIDLMAKTLDRSQDETKKVRAWALGSLAEMQVRQGDLSEAEEAFKSSLKLNAHDTFVKTSYSDLLLTTGRPRTVLTVIKKNTQSESLLLRRVLALAALEPGSLRFQKNKDILREKFDRENLRGQSVHIRERAIADLIIFKDFRHGLEAAIQNFKIQREPIDLYVLALAAIISNDKKQFQYVEKYVSRVKIEDVRLTNLLEYSGRDKIPSELSFGVGCAR